VALVKCKECGQDVSNNAWKCPSCGAGYFSTFGFRLRDGFNIVLVLFILMYFIYDSTGLTPFQVVARIEKARELEQRKADANECMKVGTQRGKTVDQLFDECLPKPNN